jgi:enoyl-CoA hydratase/carnithine racemase
VFREVVSRFYAQAERVFAIAKPMVAAVHGPAVGAGLGLALACDLRVTCSDAFFAGNFVRLGIHPGFALTITLPELIGPGRASDLLLTGRRVSGEEAVEIGLAERFVPGDKVRDAAIELAHEIAEAAPLAVTATRATLRAGLADRVKAALERELEEQARLMETTDAGEGISAMLARRPPNFRGE